VLRVRLGEALGHPLAEEAEARFVLNLLVEKVEKVTAGPSSSHLLHKQSLERAPYRSHPMTHHFYQALQREAAYDKLLDQKYALRKEEDTDHALVLSQEALQREEASVETWQEALLWEETLVKLRKAAPMWDKAWVKLRRVVAKRPV